MSKISRQVRIAHTPVHVSTSLPEDVLQSVVAFVEERFNRHDKTIDNKSDDNKRAETLIITLLDVAAELFSMKQELKKIRMAENEAFAAVEVLNQRLDDFSKQIEK